MRLGNYLGGFWPRKRHLHRHFCFDRFRGRFQPCGGVYPTRLLYTWTPYSDSFSDRYRHLRILPRQKDTCLHSRKILSLHCAGGDRNDFHLANHPVFQGIKKPNRYRSGFLNKGCQNYFLGAAGFAAGAATGAAAAGAGAPAGRGVIPIFFNTKSEISASAGKCNNTGLAPVPGS